MEKVTFKYEIGQMVTLTHCPSFDNMQLGKYVYEHDFKPKDYKVASYFYRVDEEGNTSIRYQLDAYLDEYIQYHNRIPEEHLEGELHEHTEEIDFHDVHGNPISIGDYAYSGIYYGSPDNYYVSPNFTFARQMQIIGFEYSNKGTFYVDGVVNKNVSITALCRQTDPEYIGRHKYTETLGLMVKATDEKFVEDYVNGCKMHRFNPTVDRYGDHHEEWLRKLGVYDEVCKLYKKRPATKKKATKTVKTEAVVKDCSGYKVAEEVRAMLAGMSEEEKAEMLKQLTKKN